MSCEKNSKDVGRHLDFTTLSGTISTQINTDGSSSEAETKQCTVMPTDRDVRHIVRIAFITNRYFGKRVKVRASILANVLVTHAKFDVPRIGKGQLAWEDEASIPAKFRDVKLEYHVKGTEKIGLQVEAENPWVTGLFQRVDLGDLEFPITLG